MEKLFRDENDDAYENFVFGLTMTLFYVASL